MEPESIKVNLVNYHDNIDDLCILEESDRDFCADDALDIPTDLYHRYKEVRKQFWDVHTELDYLLRQFNRNRVLEQEKKDRIERERIRSIKNAERKAKYHANKAK